MESYLNSKKLSIGINDPCSSFSECTIGVPHRSYINDLPLICLHVHVQMYADDQVIYTHGTTREQTASKPTAVLKKGISLVNSLLPYL